ARCQGLSGDVAVNPFHGIRSGERETTSQQFVQDHPKGVQITARIDRTIHSAGLLGSHVGEGAGDEFGGLRTLALARQSRGDTKAPEAGMVQRRIGKHVGWLELLVYETLFMNLADCGCEANRTVKKRL